MTAALSHRSPQIFRGGADSPPAPAPAPPPRGPPSRPRRRSGRSLQGETGLVLDVLDPDPVGTGHEHRPCVRSVDLFILEAALAGALHVLLVGVHEQRQVVQQRLFDRAIGPLYEIDRLVTSPYRLRTVAFSNPSCRNSDTACPG